LVLIGDGLGFKWLAFNTSSWEFSIKKMIGGKKKGGGKMIGIFLGIFEYIICN
jgi:hypothetical protein